MRTICHEPLGCDLQILSDESKRMSMCRRHSFTLHIVLFTTRTLPKLNSRGDALRESMARDEHAHKRIYTPKTLGMCNPKHV